MAYTWVDKSDEARKAIVEIMSRIRIRAYEIYLETGCTDEVANWLKAEDEICVEPLDDYKNYMETLPKDALDPKPFVRKYAGYAYDLYD